MITVWTVVVVLACIFMVGLVLDGGVILRGRNSTFDLASGAARAGAQELDQAALVRGDVRIDPAAAGRAAQAYLAEQGTTGTVSVVGNRITVRVHRRVALQILQPASVSVDQTSAAVARKAGN